MKQIIYVTTLLVAIILQGCAMSNISKDYSFESNKTNGLLVGSITYEGYYTEYTVFLRNLDTGKVHRISAGGSATPFNLITPKGNLDHLGVKGDLFAVELMPGNYEVFSWMVGDGSSVLVKPKKNFSIKLRIHSNTALYFGSVNFKQTASFGLTVSGANAYYVNQYKRDVKEFKKKYPKLRLVNVQNVLENNQKIALGGNVEPDSKIIFEAISRSLLMPTPY